FTDGGNVGDHDQLVDIAASAGVDPDKARGWLAGDEGIAETRAAIDHARQLGIQAVPTFVFEGKYAVQGAQEASTFLRVLEQVAAESSTPPVSAAPADETACTDDSCAI